MTDATLADFETEGRKYGEAMARGEKRVLRRALAEGVLSEENFTSVLSPALTRDWNSVRARLRDAGASPIHIEVYMRAALDERARIGKMEFKAR